MVLLEYLAEEVKVCAWEDTTQGQGKTYTKDREQCPLLTQAWEQCLLPTTEVGKLQDS